MISLSHRVGVSRGVFLVIYYAENLPTLIHKVGLDRSRFDPTPSSIFLQGLKNIDRADKRNKISVALFS